jgi:hypothetical protein
MKALIKKQFNRFCDFIEEGTFIVMLTMWAAGYFASFAIAAMDIMNKTAAIFGAVFSMGCFGVGYILYKLNKEKKKET